VPTVEVQAEENFVKIDASMPLTSIASEHIFHALTTCEPHVPDLISGIGEMHP
jgi:hypothetical protein